MLSPLSFSDGFWRLVPAALLTATLASLLLAVSGNAQAQTQEKGLLNRMEHPDRTIAYPLSGKQFSANASFKNKQASVRAFALGKTAAVRGDGAFNTRSFVSSAYHSKDFNLADSASSKQKSFGQTNKLFDTRSVDVREARDAGKTMAVNGYDSRDPYIVHGKRQDTYDEMLKRKKFSIEEVRELLNKNQ